MKDREGRVACYSNANEKWYWGDVPLTLSARESEWKSCYVELCEKGPTRRNMMFLFRSLLHVLELIFRMHSQAYYIFLLSLSFSAHSATCCTDEMLDDFEIKSKKRYGKLKLYKVSWRKRPKRVNELTNQSIF